MCLFKYNFCIKLFKFYIFSQGMLFKFDSIRLSYGEKVIFDSIHFVCNKGDRIGIIGDNGVGKTSFFRVFLHTVPSEGSVVIQNKNYGYLSQDDLLGESIVSYIRKQELEELMSDPKIQKNETKYLKIIQEYNDLISSTDFDYMTELVRGFGFKYDIFKQEQKENLSGGELTKLKLIQLFSKKADYYLLDEPSNHLDSVAKKYLIQKLNELSTFLIISHDVDLLNKTCSSILEIKDTKIKIYPGNYDFYIAQKEKENEEIKRLQVEKSKEKNKILTAIDATKIRSGEKIKSKISHLKKGQVLRDMGSGHGSMEKGIALTSGKIKKMKQKADSIKIPTISQDDVVRIKYTDFVPSHKDVFVVTDLKKSFNTFDLFVNYFELKRGEKVAIQGENGSGKSTFLKLLLGVIKPNTGSIIVGKDVKMGFVSQKNETFHQNHSILEELMKVSVTHDENAVRKYLGSFLFKKNDVFKKISDLSGGEKVRVAILKTILMGSNVLLLDEPSNHLDIRSKNLLGEALKDYPGTILVISHDDSFLDLFVTRKICVDKGRFLN